MQALLDINEYFVREIIIKENPKYKPKEVYEGEVKVSFNITRKDSSLLFKIDMGIQAGSSKKMVETDPYYTSLKLTGLFSFFKETEENTIAKMINLNGLSILYGVARGVVAQTTANCIHGKFILPSINFVELLKRKLAKERRKKK
jgi:preprotein translocase subunit SecB